MIKRSEKEITKKWKYQSDKPLVSCCCISYNHEKYIESALDSILMQKTNFPFEIIVRDDCSTDQTQNIIKKYAIKFPSIIRPVLEQENQYSKGVNPGLATFKHAKGKYIAILECDDHWTDSNKLQKQADFLEKNKDYIISYHDCNLIDENGRLISNTINPSLKDYSSDELKCGDVFIHPNTTLFRNIDISFPKIFDEVLNGDIVLFHLLGFYGKGKFQTDIKNSVYRVHGKGIWSSLDRIQKMKNNVKTKQALQMNLSDRPELVQKIDRNIRRSLFSHLRQSLTERDFIAYFEIIKYILSNKKIDNRILLGHLKDLFGRLQKKLAAKR